MESFEGETAYARYSSFDVGDAASGYTLSLGGYSGTGGDCMATQNGQKFSTHDNDQDHSTGSCATNHKGGWWYNACHCSNLNGRYLSGAHTSYADGINFDTFKGYYYSLKTTVMKLRRKS